MVSNTYKTDTWSINQYYVSQAMFNTENCIGKIENSTVQSFGLWYSSSFIDWSNQY